MTTHIDAIGNTWDTPPEALEDFMSDLPYLTDEKSESMSRENVAFKDVAEDMTVEVTSLAGRVIRGAVVAVTGREFTIVDDDTGWDVTIGRDEYDRITTEKPEKTHGYVVRVEARTYEEADEVMKTAHVGLPLGTPFSYSRIGELD